MNPTPLIELENVSKIFQIRGSLSLTKRSSIKAVDSVSFKIPSDKPLITGLVGESGSGKTTISRIILGLYEPSTGETFHLGRKISDWLRKNRLEYLRNVQPIFQDPYSTYNPFYRVDHVLRVAVKKFKLASSKNETDKLIINAMEAMGLRPEDLLGRYPHQLSGGERQRIMLTRILLIKPKLIIADEPISMIDVSLKAMFLNHLLSFKKDLGISCLYITHDLNVTSYVTNNIIVLCHGRVIEKGPTEDIIEKPLHPYTDLLVRSIAVPDPKRRWSDNDGTVATDITFKDLKAEKGCIYQTRCPHATARCKKEVPNLVNTSSGRMVACFLHE